MNKTKTVSMSLRHETVAEIDQQRGLAKRSTFVQSLLERVLGKRS
jgi:metal-responsive CopG/Arc/MetJ family transcriptional regulator